MVFMAMAMLYYGLIMFKLRRFNKIKNEEKNLKENDAILGNAILKWDRVMLVFYCSAFGLYNAGYFMKYFLK